MAKYLPITHRVSRIEIRDIKRWLAGQKSGNGCLAVYWETVQKVAGDLVAEFEAQHPRPQRRKK